MKKPFRVTTSVGSRGPTPGYLPFNRDPQVQTVPNESALGTSGMPAPKATNKTPFRLK